jgi:hypothetical protein
VVLFYKIYYQGQLPSIGGVISNCILKSLRYATLVATNAQLENNTIINHSGLLILIAVPQYIRNNKIIKHQAQSVSNQLVKGNSIL